MFLAMYITYTLIAFLGLIASCFVQERLNKLILLVPPGILFPVLATTAFSIDVIECTDTACTLVTHISQQLGVLNQWLAWVTYIFVFIYVLIFVVTLFNIKKENDEQLY